MKTNIKSLVLAGLFIAVTSPALAGGPIAQCAAGQAFVWGNGGANIPFNPDLGDLVTAGDNAAAVALVEAAFQVWEDVPTSTASYLNAGPLPVDVTGTNVLTYWAETSPDGLSPIIFDFDGSAGATLGFPSGVLGVAGIAWVNTVTCEATEGVALLIGPTFAGDPTAGFDVAVHEFGHYSGLGHTVVNGQIYLGSVGGDNSGPTPNDTFTPIPGPFTEVVETMYPFYYGPPIGTATLHKDDAATLSELYPAPDFATNFATISGSAILGTSPVTGANVIARNVADPFNDAVSAISGDFSAGADAFTGQWDIEGLTPGAEYAVYVDEILAGGFSTPLLSPLPGPEDFWNGSNESSNVNSDDPAIFTTVSAAPGGTASGINIVFNQPGEFDPLPVGDDGSVQLALPFQFCVAGQSFDSVFVNANGNLTFGAADTAFPNWIEDVDRFLDGPPRVAGLWDDLQPVDLFGNAQGSVFYSQTNDSFTVTWDSVPEWGFPSGFGANTFDITLYDNSKDCVDDGSSDDGSSDDDSSDDDSGRGDRKGADIKITYGALNDGDDGALAGVSGGLFSTSGAETASDLSSKKLGGKGKKIKLDKVAAVYEIFANANEGVQDLKRRTLRFDKVGKPFKDKFEKNNSLKKASKILTPFDTLDTRKHYSSIDPAAADIDFYRFSAEAGQYLIAEVARGQIDSVLGLYLCAEAGDDSKKNKVEKCDPDTAVQIGFDDDGGTNLLSRIEGVLPVTGTYGLAVTFCCDYDFDGVDPGQGLPFDWGRYVLEVRAVDGIPLPLGDDTSVNLSGFGFGIPFDGAIYTDLHVNSNGNITFGAGDPFGFIPSVTDFENGPPRVAPLWDDLDPTGALVLADTDFSTELTITWVDVPLFGGSGANNFSVTLFSNGNVEYDYGSVTSISPLIGASEGDGPGTSTATDLSATGGGAISDSPVEDFFSTGGYDLANPDALTFTP